MKPYFLKMNNEEGTTLVELLAAITILTIIVLAFLAYFIQAGKTNNMTNEVNEATFLAQEEMERVTSLSNQKKTYTEVKAYYQTSEHGYTTKEKNGAFDASRKSGPYNTKIVISEADGLYKAVVEITEGNNGRAKMETRLPFAE